MDVVSVDYFKREFFMCRIFDNNIVDYAEELYHYSLEPIQNMLCIKPRAILLAGTGDVTKADLLSVRGAIKGCPEGDPDFLNCLCEAKVTDRHLQQLSNLFSKRQLAPRCPFQQQMRPTLSQRDIETLTVVNTTTVTKRLVVSVISCTFAAPTYNH